MPKDHSADHADSRPVRDHNLIQLLQEIAVAANEARTVRDALEIAVERICHYTGWPTGHAWWPSTAADASLVSSGVWYASPASRFAPLWEATRSHSFAQGIGLPGRVWTSRLPAWINDVAKDTNFPRAEIASGLGIHAAFAFPVEVAGEVVAVLEFFSEESGDPDPAFLRTMANIGTQLGRVVERQRAEEALRTSEERYRTLADAAVDAIVTSGYDGIIGEWNRGAEAMFGYGRAEAIGRPLTIIMPERYRPLHEKGMRRYQETATPHVIGRTVELHGLRANGEEFPIELSLSRWQASGEVFFTGIIRDVTERHAAAEALRKSKRSLERSYSNLKARNQQLQEFSYAASHDLQEPLRKIITFSEIVREDLDDKVDPESRENLERIANAAERMSALVRDLLEYSRVTTRGEALRPVDLGAVVQDVLADIEVLIDESGGTVQVGDLPTIDADQIQMRQLFQNLISNALKFRRRDVPAVVKISATVEPAASSEDGHIQICKISVADNGIGFEQKYARRVFSPFQRLHTRDEYSGTGIGLALCRRIVERHHGRIRAHSTPGEGTTITIKLPTRR